MNSNEQASSPTIPTLTSTPSEKVESSSLEAPLLTLNPQMKPILEMSDLELAEWHSKLRDIQSNPQTLMAHLRTKVSVEKGPKRDMSEYV